MREFTLSATGTPPVRALAHGRRFASGACGPPGHCPLLLAGDSRLDLAAVAAWALATGHQIVLRPRGVTAMPAGVAAEVTAAGVLRTPAAAAPPSAPGPAAWRVAMYTSGSTARPRAYGFSLAQLDQLASWYTTIYTVTGQSVICTALPVTYNFTFVAGLYLAAKLGARLHLADPAAVFTDAASLARHHDRCVVLGNPVLLAKPPPARLPGSVLIDSGGAPLSTTAICRYREDVADLREGYGLTETGSLTHFDTEATAQSLGTVGAAVPGVHAGIVDRDGQPRIAVTTPALGAPADDPATVPAPRRLETSDAGRLDDAGRLRVLGRADDHPIGGLWPRDTLDLIGPVLGTACALIRHPSADTVHVRLHRAPSPATVPTICSRVMAATGLPATAVTIDTADGPLLHSSKLTRSARNQHP